MKINFKYILITAIAVFFSFELHELAHFFAGGFLGNKMGMTLNSGYPVNGFYLKELVTQKFTEADLKEFENLNKQWSLGGRMIGREEQ